MPSVVSKIKPGIADGFRDGGWHECLNRQAGLHPRANLRRGKPKRKTFQHANPKARWGCRRARPGARNRHKFNQPGQFVGSSPLGQLRDVVRTDEIEERCARTTTCVVANGIDCKRRAATPNLLIIQFVLRISRQGQSQDTEANLSRSGLAFGLEWRLGGRNEEQLRQSEFFERRLRRQQMSQMNWVKRPAK